jgi:ABC-type multidrug transport system permease subunit
VSTGDPLLDRIIYVASWMFMVGMIMIVSTAAPAVAQRFPRLFLGGFLLALLSFVVVGVSAMVLR